MTPKDRAEKSAAAMWAEDYAAQWAGLRIVDVDEGVAVLDMTVEKHHCNGHSICHGGVTFTRADTACA